MADEKKLVSLADFNLVMERHRLRGDREGREPNGIACPECGKELFDSHPGFVLTSYPEQCNVHCPACGHRTYRTV